MIEIRTVFTQYQEQVKKIIQDKPEDLDAALTALENRVADNSGLPEGDRLELRAYMVEFRRQTLDGYEAAAGQGHLSNPDSGPRSNEYGSSDT